MREIKFRGKSFDNGEWIYGDYHKRAGGVNCIIKMEPDENGKVVYAVHQAVPDTIGQFTGVLDKNGKEIYEGDVLSVREWKNLAFGMFNHDEMKDLSLDDCKGELLKDIKSLVYWDEGSMLATEQNGCAYYMCSFWHEDTLITQPIFDIEIIGNIHDNPELLNK